MAYRSSISVNTITRSFSSLGSGLNNARKTIVNISRSVGRDNENKKRAISRDSLLFQRKRENVRRKKQRSILELSGVGAAFRAPAKVLQNTSKSIFGRVLSFAGTIMAGWLIYNLPTITGMGQELIARIKRLTLILSTFIPNTGRILNEFKDLFGAYATNFITFDFFDSSGRVKKAMDDLSLAFTDMNGSFEEALKLITTPLTEPLEGPGAPPPGTEYPIEPGPSGGDKGRARVGTKEQRALLDTLAQAEGTYQSGYSTWLGHRKHGPENLTNLTIDQVHELQGSFLRKFGAKSAAVGRYQFVPLKEHAKRFGANTATQKFTPEFQDKLALFLAENRGVDTKRPITNADVYKLGREWAALPGGGYGQDRYSAKQIISMYNNNLKTTPAQPPTSRPTPAPTPPKGTLKLIPQIGPGGFIQGGSSGPGGETTYATHFHIDLKNGNYTAEGREKIREVAFRAIKAMQARGSTVYLTNYSDKVPVSKNDSILRSQILIDQQKHDERTTPGIDIQEHNPNIQRTFPSQPGSATKFPFAVGSVYWRGGYGREAEIIGSGGVTVSHGAPGSAPSQVPQQVSSTKLSSTQVASAAKPLTSAVAAAPERKGQTVIVTPQMQQPQMIASAPPQAAPSPSTVEFPVNNIIPNMLLTQLAYT